MKDVKVYVNSVYKDNNGVYCNKLIYENYSKSKCIQEKVIDSSTIELKSIVDSLKTLKEPCNVKLYTKCEYIVKIYEEGTLEKWVENEWIIKNGYKRRVKEIANKELWIELYMLSKIHHIDLVRISKKHEIMKKMKWYMSKKMDGNIIN